MTSAGGTMSSKSRDGSGAADLLSWGLGELETRLVVVYWQVHVAETPTQVGVIKGACWFQQKSLEAGWASRKAGGSPVSKELYFVFALPFLSLASSQGWLSTWSQDVYQLFLALIFVSAKIVRFPNKLTNFGHVPAPVPVTSQGVGMCQFPWRRARSGVGSVSFPETSWIAKQNWMLGVWGGAPEKSTTNGRNPGLWARKPGLSGYPWLYQA